MKEGTAHVAQVAALVQLIFTASEKLEYPAWEASRAAVLVHKYIAYFGSIEIRSSDQRELIFLASVLFLCGKASENIRSIRDVINVVRRCKGLDIDSLETGDAYDRLRDSVLEQEQIVLRAVALDLDSCQDQHKYLLNFCRFFSVEEDVVNCALQFCNDSFLVAACVLRPPAIVAAACLYVALSLRQMQNQEQPCEESVASYCAWIRTRLCEELQIREEELESAAQEVASAQVQFVTGSRGEIVAVLE